MGFKFNPITSNLDLVGSGGTPGGSDTQIQFNDGGSFGGDSTFVFDKTNKRVGIGTTIPTSDLSFGGGTARTIGMERNTASETGGLSLTISGSGATSGSTDKSGGQLILSAGIGTGNASNNGILFRNPLPNASGTTDQALQTFLIGYAQSSTDFRLILNNTSTGSFGHGLSIGGQRASTIAMVRQTAANTAGNILLIQSGGSTSGATDKWSGSLDLSTGIATGSGSGNIRFLLPYKLSTGTADSTPQIHMILGNVTSTTHAAVLNLDTTETGGSGTAGIQLNGDRAQILYVKRHTTADTAGNNLTIQAGGAISGATDKAGGDLLLYSGLGTGTGSSRVRIAVPTPSTTGTTDNALGIAATFWKSAATSYNLSLNNTTTGAVTNGLSINGDTQANVVAVRNTVANTAGNALVVQSGAATSGATDKAGGILSLKSGVSTGTGLSQIIFQTATPAVSTNTTDNAFATRLTISNLEALFVPKVTAPAIKLTTGAAAEAFLVSDASGDATWENLAWTSWNPTPTNFVVGAGGTLTANYKKIGKTVHARCSFKFGSGSSVSGAISISLPFTSISYPGLATTQIIGNATMLDSGSAVFYGYCVWASTTSVTMQVSVTSGTYAGSGGISSTIPMTWTTNDEFYMDFIYEAA